MFELKFLTDNAAFDDDPRGEIARILRKLADDIDNGSQTEGGLYDLNGNRVGAFEIVLMPSDVDVDNLFTSATNEGALYPLWCKMARDRFNTPDGEWADVLRPYVRDLVRTGRAERSALAANVVNAAAAMLRDYYVKHVSE
jgi:hypothetical protein